MNIQMKKVSLLFLVCLGISASAFAGSTTTEQHNKDYERAGNKIEVLASQGGLLNYGFDDKDSKGNDFYILNRINILDSDAAKKGITDATKNAKALLSMPNVTLVTNYQVTTTIKTGFFSSINHDLKLNSIKVKDTELGTTYDVKFNKPEGWGPRIQSADLLAISKQITDARAEALKKATAAATSAASSVNQSLIGTTTAGETRTTGTDRTKTGQGDNTGQSVDSKIGGSNRGD
jgi:hypothetical protein